MTNRLVQLKDKALSVLRKSIAGIVCLGVLGSEAEAQVNMTRSTFTSAYTAISVGGGATAATGAQGDDATAQSIPIGFTFNYLGTGQTAVSICSNGWLTFGTSSVISRLSPDLFSTATPNSTVAPWWDDLNTTTTGGGSVLYQTTGSAGSQVFTVQWTSPAYFTGATRMLTFQVKLYETSDVIEFWYGNVIAGTINSAESASIGLETATGGGGQYLDAVTGSSNVGNAMITASSWPAYHFRFTPGAPASPLSGSYNVGVGQTYNSLTEAIADLNHKGVSGPVTLNLTDAQYDITPANGGNIFPLLLGAVAGTSAANTVTITKSGAPAIITYSGSTSSVGCGIANAASSSGVCTASSDTEPIIGLVGTDYITLNNLDVRGGAASVVDKGIALYNSSATDGATNNTIQNVTVSMNRINTNSRGFSSNTGTVPTSAAGANSNNTFRDFTIKSVYGGIQLTGNATYPDVNNAITNSVCTNFNTVGDPATPNDIGNGTLSTVTYGIRVTNQSGITVSNNSIRNVGTLAAIADGIYVELFQGISTVSNNKIQTIKNNSTASTSAAHGMRTSHATTGTHTLRIYNNSISEILSSFTGTATATRGIRGIYMNWSGGGSTSQVYEVYNNNISIDGSATPNISSTCIEHGGSNGPVFKLGNNVFANFTAAQGSTAKHSCIVSTSSSAYGPSGTTSNNNAFFIANDLGTSGFIGIGNTVTHNTTALWSTAMSPAGLETASVTANPGFANNINDLHTSAAELNATGLVPPAYVTNDLDCASRTPDNDMGAYILNGCIGAPTAGSISGATNVCNGTGTTLTLSGMSTGLGITYQWASSTTDGGPYTTLLGTSATQATGNLAATTYYVVTVTCSYSGGSAVTTQKTVTVDPAPTLSVTPSSTTYCLGGNAVPLTATGGDTYTWAPATGLSATTGATVDASPNTTTNYTVTATLGICTATSTVTVTVAEKPIITALTASPSTICYNGSSTLTATAATTSSYAVSAIPYTPIATPGVGVTTLANAGVAVTGLSSGTLDDGSWQNQTIPFDFRFFGTNYNSFAVSTNGVIYLGAGAINTATGYGNTFPSASGVRPSIGALYTDLLLTSSGTVEYFTSGTAPNRQLVINWSGPFYVTGSPTGLAVMQLILNEGSNTIEVHTTSSTGNNSAVQGVQNAAGTVAFTVSGRNNSTFTITVPDAYKWTPNGGAATYAWTPATFLSGTTGASVNANNVTATTAYTVDATIAGCTSSADVTITVTDPAAPTGAATQSFCQGAPTVAELTATGSSIQWYSTPTGGTPLPMATTLVNNTSYYASQTVGGCESSNRLQVMVNVSNGLTGLTVAKTNNICNGACEGTATINTTSGVAPYTYLWSNGQTTQTATGLCYGAYNVIVTDAGGCTAQKSSIFIFQPTPIVSTPTITPATCSTQGSISVTTSGGTGAHTFLWSTGATTNSIAGLNGAAYGLTVTDVAGCQKTFSYLVDDICYVLSISKNDITTCTQTCTGDATVTVIDGVAPYTYLWSNGQTTATATGLCKQNYTVTVTDANNIVRTATVAIAYNKLTATHTYTPTTCNGACDGTATVVVSGGQAPYTYAWNSNAGGQTTPTATGLCYGTYNVTITAANGCSMVKKYINVTQPPAIQVTVGTTPSSCLNDGTASATVTGGGVAPFSFNWSNSGNTNSIMNLAPGNYYVTVTDANGCYKVKTANIADNCQAKPTENNDLLAEEMLMQTETPTNENTDINETLRLNDVVLVDAFNVYPNPNNGQFFIEIALVTETTDARLRIHDVLGRTLLEQDLQGQFFKVPVDANTWTSGAYFVQLISAEGQTTRKVLITNE